MDFGRFAFGSIEIDGVTYGHDVVIEGGRVRKRKKGPSRSLRSRYGHTPLSAAEDIPWACSRLLVGSGAVGALPVLEDVAEEAERRHVQLVVLATADAIDELRTGAAGTNAILHITC
jgi:hypothetical protein